MRVAVLTAVFGGIDEPKPFPSQDCNCDRFLITGSTLLPAREKARYFKLQSHVRLTEYDVFVWLDGNIEIKSPRFVPDLIKALNDCEIAINPHPQRSCIYDEAAFIVRRIEAGNKYLATRYDVQSVLAQSEVYRASGHPAEYGLYWCGLFAWRVTPRTVNFFNDWWGQCLTWPQSIDQIPFPYLVRTHGIKIGRAVNHVSDDNPTFNRHEHLHDI